jgi:hypothetical protein
MPAPQSDSISAEFLARLPVSPDIYAQKLDVARELALLVQFDINAYQAASFLDDRILTPGTKGTWVPIARLVEAARLARDLRPLHFIFHTGHVGSTLVSRLLDATGHVLSLREPLTLRNLADAADVLGQPESLLSASQFDALLETVLRLWSRGYDATRSSVVLKATSSAGRLAVRLLAKQETARAIYLNLQSEPYLATLLAGQNSPIDLRGHGPGRMRRLQARIGTALTPLHTLSLGELAAMSWLAETWSQHDAMREFPERTLALDFDRFLKDVRPSMERVLHHFGLPGDPQYLQEVARNPVLTRYSKAPEHAYTPEIRARVLDDSRQHNREEIRKGLDWLERLGKADAGVAAVLNGARDGA